MSSDENSGSKSTSIKKQIGPKVGSSNSSTGVKTSSDRENQRRETDKVEEDRENEDSVENEELLHERMHRRLQTSRNHSIHQPADLRLHNTNDDQRQHQHHHHHHHHHQHHDQHVKERIKPDPTMRARQSGNNIIRSPVANERSDGSKQMQGATSQQSPRIVTALAEEQLHQRLVDSMSERKTKTNNRSDTRKKSQESRSNSERANKVVAGNQKSHTNSSSSSSSSGSKSSSRGQSQKSPPPEAIIIPASVAKSLSVRRSSNSQNQLSSRSSSSSSSLLPQDTPSAISPEQFQYGNLLKPGEVQILYRSPDSNSLDRHLKEEQAKQVAPNMRQSPIAIMSVNPTYELQNKPLVIEYPATVENLRLNNTGFSWEVKIPYQISMTTALYGAHLNTSHRYRLDQFHCHWGSSDFQGSEHTVDNKCYSAEIHFVHYNMEKYHTLSRAARHPDGLVVLSVFLDAQNDHHNHAELEKIVSNLKHVTLKGEHAIIKQTVRIENLLPPNKSYWSYQGSLTTAPYFESVTWFVLKQPIRCNPSQIQRFRNLKSSIRPDDQEANIRTNHRGTQPLNGRTIVNYDENSGSARL